MALPWVLLFFVLIAAIAGLVSFLRRKAQGRAAPPRPVDNGKRGQESAGRL